jgi:hypothetical protein
MSMDLDQAIHEDQLQEQQAEVKYVLRIRFASPIQVGFRIRIQEE